MDWGNATTFFVVIRAPQPPKVMRASGLAEDWEQHGNCVVLRNLESSSNFGHRSRRSIGVGFHRSEVQSICSEYGSMSMSTFRIILQLYTGVPGNSFHGRLWKPYEDYMRRCCQSRRLLGCTRPLRPEESKSYGIISSCFRKHSKIFSVFYRLRCSL